MSERLWCSRLVGTDEAGTHPNTGSAQAQCGRQAAAVKNATGRNTDYRATKSISSVQDASVPVCGLRDNFPTSIHLCLEAWETLTPWRQSVGVQRPVQAAGRRLGLGRKQD